MLYSFRSLLSLFAVALASACGTAADVPVAAPPASRQALQLDAALREALALPIREYITAVLSDDESRLRASASAALMARIATRGPAQDLASRTASFLARERFKLQREFATSPAQPLVSSGITVSVDSASLEPDGGTVAVSVRLNDHLLPKPLYLLREGAAYRMNVVAPKMDLAASTSNYRAQNDDPVIRSFSCSGYGGYTIGVTPSQRLIPCIDSCHVWWFDGTTFEAQGSLTDCDYNTWGVDVYLRGGYPVCNDPC